MNKTLLLLSTIVLVFTAVSVVTSDPIWAYCSGDINATFNIDTLTVTPDPPVISKSCTVALKGTLTQPVTSGSSVLTVSMFIAGQWRTLPEFTNDVCSVVKCPVAAGPFTFSTTFTIPFITPHGHYRGSFQMTDQNSRNITCLTYDTNLGSRAEQEVEVEQQDDHIVKVSIQ
eukprot:gene454-542_t